MHCYVPITAVLIIFIYKGATIPDSGSLHVPAHEQGHDFLNYKNQKYRIAYVGFVFY